MKSKIKVKKNILPIIIVNKGNPWYLKYVIKKAEEAGNNVILLGDATNRAICRNWVGIEEYRKGMYIKQFQEKYVHMSTLPYDFEYFCFERHFIVYEYAKKNHLDQFVIMDSDVLVYDLIDNNNFTNCECASSWTGEGAVSPHFTYIKIDVLESFLKFCIEIYSNKLEILENRWKTFLDTNSVGGNCDMTLLYYWRESGQNMENLVEKGYDSCLSAVDSIRLNYEISRWHKNIKKVTFINNKPYAYRNGERIQLKTIHAQGGSKRYIKVLYKCSNNHILYYLADMRAYGLGIKIKCHNIKQKILKKY